MIVYKQEASCSSIYIKLWRQIKQTLKNQTYNESWKQKPKTHPGQHILMDSRLFRAGSLAGGRLLADLLLSGRCHGCRNFKSLNFQELLLTCLFLWWELNISEELPAKILRLVLIRGNVNQELETWIQSEHKQTFNKH